MSNMKSSLSKIGDYNDKNSPNVYRNDREKENEINRVNHVEDIEYRYQDKERNNDLYLHYEYERNWNKPEENYEKFSNQHRDENYNDIYKRTGEILNRNYQENPNQKSSNYSNINYESITPQAEIYNSQKNDMFLEKQISDLQFQIDELQTKNKYLQMALADSRKDLSYIKHQKFSEYGSMDFDSAQKNENLIEEIKSILSVNSSNEILSTIMEWIEKEKKIKLKSEVCINFLCCKVN